MKFAFKVVNDVLSTAIIAPSEFAKQNLIEMGASPQKIATIINGASPLRTLDDDEKEIISSKGDEDEDLVSLSQIEEILKDTSKIENFAKNSSFIQE